MKNSVEIFKSLSDPNRIRIMKMLEARKMCVCEITEILGLATSTVSKHLQLLKNAGLVEEEKSGKWVYYKKTSDKNDTELSGIHIHVEKILNKDKTVISDKRKTKTVTAEKLCSTK